MVIKSIIVLSICCSYVSMQKKEQHKGFKKLYICIWRWLDSPRWNVIIIQCNQKMKCLPS